MKRKISVILAIVILAASFNLFSASAVTVKKIAKIKQTASKSDSVSIKWSNISKDVKYDVKISNDKKAKRTYKDITKNSYKITKLKAGKTYALKVRAKKNKEKGEWSDAVKVTTSPKVTYNWEKGKLNASWTKVKGATSYALKVELNFNKNKYVRVKNITTNKYTISNKNLSGLSINKVYNVIVRPYKNGDPLFTGRIQTRDIEITGHRGRMDIAPENTMASFEEAYKAGYDSFEADFWETKTGEIIICHDSILTMCNSSQDIRNLTAATIKNYPIKVGTNIDKYKTQYLPTVDEVVKAVAGWKMKLYLHLKDPNITDNGLKKILTTVRKYGIKDKVTVFSPNKTAFERIVKTGLRPGFLNLPNSASDISKSLTYAGSKKAKVVIFRFTEDMSADLIKFGHSKGLKIGCYNVSNKTRGSIFTNMGPDFLITNKFFFN